MVHPEAFSMQIKEVGLDSPTVPGDQDALVVSRLERPQIEPTVTITRLLGRQGVGNLPTVNRAWNADRNGTRNGNGNVVRHMSNL